MVPPHVFAGAPRIHDGANLKPDGVPVTLQRGERVLNQKKARAYECSYPTQRRGRQCQDQTPNPIAFIESVNASLQDELLTETAFPSLAEVRILLAQWRRDYNWSEPHGRI